MTRSMNVGILGFLAALFLTGAKPPDPSLSEVPDVVTNAVEHTSNIALGLVDVCSNFTGPDFGDPVGPADAVIITGYVITGTTCTCQP